MATKKIHMTDLFDTFLTTYKQTHVSVNGQQVQIECLRLWREIKKGKGNSATKSEAQNFMLQWKMNVKKPGKGNKPGSGNKPSLSFDDENVFEVSPPSLSRSQQTTTPTDVVPSSSLSQTTAGTQAAPKPKVTPKQDELNKDINIENEILVSLY